MKIENKTETGDPKEKCDGNASPISSGVWSLVDTCQTSRKVTLDTVLATSWQLSFVYDGSCVMIEPNDTNG